MVVANSEPQLQLINSLKGFPLYKVSSCDKSSRLRLSDLAAKIVLMLRLSYQWQDNAMKYGVKICPINVAWF